MNLDPNMTPLEYFNYFFDDDMVKTIKNETNIYAHLNKGELIWKDVNEDEMRLFLIVRMLMGIVRKPTQELYWKKEGVCYLPYTLIQ